MNDINSSGQFNWKFFVRTHVCVWVYLDRRVRASLFSKIKMQKSRTERVRLVLSKSKGRFKSHNILKERDRKKYRLSTRIPKILQKCTRTENGQNEKELYDSRNSRMRYMMLNRRMVRILVLATLFCTFECSNMHVWQNPWDSLANIIRTNNTNSNDVWTVENINGISNFFLLLFRMNIHSIRYSYSYFFALFNVANVPKPQNHIAIPSIWLDKNS